MNVVFVTNKLVNGGGERVLARLVSGVLAAGGVATILFLGSKRAVVPEIRKEMEAAGAKVILPDAPLAAWRALRVADALHLYNVNVYVKALPFLTFFARSRVICHVHGAAESANPLARRLFSARWNPCDEIVFVSQACRNSWGIDRGIVVSNPVTFPRSRRIAKTSAKNQFRLISVNRLVAVKRVASQIQIIAALREAHGIEATLDIVGEGPEHTKLVDLVDRLALKGKVRFLGGCAHEEVLGLYREYDGFLATSAAEGLGLGLIEALAAGLPAFAAPIPPFCEVAAIGGGVCFVDPEEPTGAAEDIADALLGNALPIADQEGLRAAFDGEAFVARMLGVYR